MSTTISCPTDNNSYLNLVISFDYNSQGQLDSTSNISPISDISIHSHLSPNLTLSQIYEILNPTTSINL